MRVRFVLVLLGLVLLGSVQAEEAGPPHEIARFDLARSTDDVAAPRSKLTRRIGRPERTPRGVVFDGTKVEGLLYGDGVRGELRLTLDLTIFVRAAFAPAIDRPLANHDTLVSRWGPAGSYALLLRSDHHRGTLHLFLSADGRVSVPFDSRYVVKRDGSFHDYVVVIRAGRHVAFYVDGHLQSVVRHPRPPAALRGTDAERAPFAIGYNSDPAPGGDHESMNGTIAGVRLIARALEAGEVASLSGVKASVSAPGRVPVEIDWQNPGATVSPRLFGHFLEHFPRQLYGAIFDPGSTQADAQGFRTDVVSALTKVGTPLVRWPGGNYTSGYDWRWGAGPRAERASRRAPHWGFEETHQFGTTEFVEMMRRVGGEPLICVGVGRDPRCPTPEDAAAWVRYCNAKAGPEAKRRKDAGYAEPLGVTLWGLGNEVWGPWQVGHYRNPDDYAKDAVRYARAMRGVDPKLRFVVVGNDRRWNERILTPAVVRMADWVAWHDYFHMGYRGPRRSHEDATEHLFRVEETLTDLGRLNHERSKQAGRKQPLMLAVDEWNEFAWNEKHPTENDRPRPYDLAHALYTAGYLNVFLRQSQYVSLGAYAPGVNGRGLIHVDERGVLERSTFHVFRLYGEAGGGRTLPCRVASPRLTASTAPALDVAAVHMGDDRVLVFAVNREIERAQSVVLRFAGATKVGEVEGTVLTAGSLADFNERRVRDRVTPRPLGVTAGHPLSLALAPRSLTVLRVKLR